MVMAKVLVIGDTHCPCMLDGYIPFLKRVYRQYKCNRVVMIGDLVDWASISYHEKMTGLKDAPGEYRKAYKQVQKLYKAFPTAHWLVGNHDALTKRQAMTAGIPEVALRSYTDLWDLPNWTSVERFGALFIDGVLYQHGDRGLSRMPAALTQAKSEGCSVVQGHLHAQAGVWYSANHRARIFGLQTGCGVDHSLEAQAYGKKYNNKPIIGCGVVDGGRVAHFIPMEL